MKYRVKGKSDENIVCYSSNENLNDKIEHEFEMSTTKVQESKFESE